MKKYILIFLALITLALFVSCSSAKNSDSSSTKYSDRLPIKLNKSETIVVTDITKENGEYNIIVEISPSFCDISDIQAVYDSWSRLLEEDEQRANELWYNVPKPHYIIASNSELSRIINDMIEEIDDGESRQGYTGINIVMTDPDHKNSISRSINENELCDRKDSDLSGIKKVIE